MGWHRIAIGIGNPGAEYESTRHNVGFMVLDLLAERLGLSFARLERRGPDGSKRFSGKVKAQVAEGRSKGKSFLLVKPQTYVNLTGEVAAPLLRFSRRSPDALFVIVDDLNLPLGRMRLRPSGSAGGHNGLKSVQQMLQTDAYPRLRLGIGPAESGDMPPDQWVDHVLGAFLQDEREVLGPVLERAADAVLAWLDGATVPELMDRYNPMPGAGPLE